jgi:hypothetical protein
MNGIVAVGTDSSACEWDHRRSNGVNGILAVGTDSSACEWDHRRRNGMNGIVAVGTDSSRSLNSQRSRPRCQRIRTSILTPLAPRALRLCLCRRAFRLCRCLCGVAFRRGTIHRARRTYLTTCTPSAPLPGRDVPLPLPSPSRLCRCLCEVAFRRGTIHRARRRYLATCTPSAPPPGRDVPLPFRLRARCQRKVEARAYRPAKSRINSGALALGLCPKLERRHQPIVRRGAVCCAAADTCRDPRHPPRYLGATCRCLCFAPSFRAKSAGFSLHPSRC